MHGLPSFTILRTFPLAKKSVICEQSLMTKPRVTDLASTVGISKTYASDILAGKQPPSRALAVHIFRTTGWRHDSIADLSDEQMNVLESIEPWKPVADRPATQGKAA